MVRAPLVAALTLAGLFVSAPFALAGSERVTISIADGLVSVRATQIPLNEILQEWTRVGGTVFVNGERVSTPTTVALTDVPEQEALAILLRPATGYLAVSRSSATGGSSRLSRVVVMTERAAPVPATAVAPAAAASTLAPMAPNPFAPTPPNPFAPPMPPMSSAPPLPGVEPIKDANGSPMQDDQAGAPPFIPAPRPALPQASPQSNPQSGGTATPGLIVQPAPTTPQAAPQSPVSR